MGRPNNQAGCTKFGKLINWQGSIRAGRVSDFSEMNKRVCPFIRQVRVVSPSQKNLMYRIFFQMTLPAAMVSIGLKM